MVCWVLGQKISVFSKCERIQVAGRLEPEISVLWPLPYPLIQLSFYTKQLFIAYIKKFNKLQKKIMKCYLYVILMQEKIPVTSIFVKSVEKAIFFVPLYFWKKTEYVFAKFFDIFRENASICEI